MGKSVPLKSKSDVLKSLREYLGFSINEIAKKLNTTPERIRKVEESDSFLTLTQLRKLSDIYQISLAAFFSDSIPQIPSIPDYRLNKEKKLKPQVFLAQKRAYYLSKEIAIFSNRKSEIPTFDTDDPIELAHKSRNYLDLQVIKNKSSREILREYKSIIEERMLIPIIEYPLKAEDVRAFSMPSEVAIIVLNEEDQPQVKLFSLFHELGHLLRKNTGICSIELEMEREEKIETFCNRFSAEFLVPEEDLKDEIKRRKFALFNDETISELSKIYGVSKQVIMLRLLWLRYLQKENYEEFKTKYQNTEEKKAFGKRNWDEVFFNRAGGLVIKEIRKAYRQGEITFADVITTLELKAKYVEKFIEG